MMETNPIKMLTDMLADMTARALETERQLQVALNDSESWFRNYQECYKQRNDLQAKLDAETELRERAQENLREEKDLHMETWGKCKELMEIAVKAGVHRESLERMIYSSDALDEVKERGKGDAE